MNDAHLHLLVNHFPIIGPVLGFGVLVTGMVIKSNSVKNTAYSLFIVSAVFAAFSMGTGEGAEEMVEHMPSVGKHVIHEHEEMAEKLALILYVLGVISIVGIYMNLKNHTKSKLLSYMTVGIALIAIYFAQQTGTTGGEVRHTEIRENAVQTNTVEQETDDED